MTTHALPSRPRMYDISYVQHRLSSFVAFSVCIIFSIFVHINVDYLWSERDQIVQIKIDNQPWVRVKYAQVFWDFRTVLPESILIPALLIKSCIISCKVCIFNAVTLCFKNIFLVQKYFSGLYEPCNNVHGHKFIKLLCCTSNSQMATSWYYSATE